MKQIRRGLLLCTVLAQASPPARAASDRCAALAGCSIDGATIDTATSMRVTRDLKSHASAPGSLDAEPGHGFLDRQRIAAGPGFDRWPTPPAASAIHPCIGTACGFSVFLQPLSRAGVTVPLGGPGHMSLWHALSTRTCDWRVSDLR